MGLLIIAAGYAVGRGHAVTTSWRGLVPTTALLWTEPLEIWDPLWMKDDPPSVAPWGLELLYRYEEGSLAAWQAHRLMDRDVDRVVEVPKAWMAGEPLVVKINPTWMRAVGAPRTLHVRVEGVEAGELSVPLSAMVAGSTGSRSPRRAPIQLSGPSKKLGPLGIGNHELKIAMTLQEGSGPSAVTIWKGLVHRMVRVVADPLDAIPADDSQESAEIVQRYLRLKPDNRPHFWWEWSGQIREKLATSAREATITADVDFLYDGRVIWTVPLKGRVLSRLTTGRTPPEFLTTQPATQTDPKWKVRIRSVPSRALENFDVQRIWVGEVTIPASEICPHPLGEPLPPTADF